MNKSRRNHEGGIQIPRGGLAQWTSVSFWGRWGKAGDVEGQRGTRLDVGHAGHHRVLAPFPGTSQQRPPFPILHTNSEDLRVAADWSAGPT